MSEWQNLKLFLVTNNSFSRDEFLDMYKNPVLIQERKKGIPVKALLKVQDALKGVVPLGDMDKTLLPGFSNQDENQDIYMFLNFSEESNHIYIGKNPPRGVKLDFPWLSDKHVRITREDMGFYTLTDLSSTGTYLNEAKMMPGVDYPLFGFCRLMFGKAFKYLFLSPDCLFDYIALTKAK